MFKIAIQRDYLQLPHAPRESFSTRWVELLAQAGHESVIVDVFRPGLMPQFRDCDGFLWWFPPLPFPRDLAKRLMLALQHAATNLTIFPDFATCWHFDDKVAQAYLLEAARIPTPRTWIFWRYADAAEFCRTAHYPLVIKLSAGFHSDNVALVADGRHAMYWVKRLFTQGVTDLDRPSIGNPRPALRRVRHRLSELLKPFARTMTPPVEKGYVLFQELVRDNAFDTRVTIIGDRAFAFRRMNRPGDFRASGGGRIDFDPAGVDPLAIRLGFRVADVLGAKSLSMDVLRRDGELVITEVSYYFEGWAIASCAGHWRREGEELVWVAGSMRAEDAILADFLARMAGRERQSHG